MAKKVRLGQKQCPKCEKWIKGPRTKVCPKCSYEFPIKQKEAPAAEATPEGVNKARAVRSYLKAHRGAKNAEVVEALAKEGIEVSAKYVGKVKGKISARKAAKAIRVVPETPIAQPVAVAAAPEAPAKAANVITLGQIKAVSEMVKTIGGFKRLHEMLSVIREVGGPKKFNELLDAMAVGEKEEGIPF